MSWLARSIANSLRLDDDDVVDHPGDHGERPQNDAGINPSSKFRRPIEGSPDLEEVDLDDGNNSCDKFSQINAFNDVDSADHDNNQGRGVKEDLSEFTETLTRQLWGVALFLAPSPPPPPPPRPRSSIGLELDQRSRDAAAEVSGSGDEEEEEEDYGPERFRESPQSFLQIGMPEPEEEDIFEDAVGITEEALDFAENTAHHPETWLNFPLSDEEELEDFEISDSQHKHARAIEHLAPRLAALRRELCPAHMTKGYFWMVYFVLLHSRLNRDDAELLSTPQLVKARAMWMKELQKQTKPEPDWLGRHSLHSEDNIHSPYENLDLYSAEDTHLGYTSHMAFPLESVDSRVTTGSDSEKLPHENREIQFIDRSVSEEDPTSKTEKEPVVSSSLKASIQEYDEHEDDWLDDDSDLAGYTVSANALVNEEDVSFSDLEDDVDFNMPTKSKAASKE